MVQLSGANLRCLAAGQPSGRLLLGCCLHLRGSCCPPRRRPPGGRARRKPGPTRTCRRLGAAGLCSPGWLAGWLASNPLGTGAWRAGPLVIGRRAEWSGCGGHTRGRAGRLARPPDCATSGQTKRADTTELGPAGRHDPDRERHSPPGNWSRPSICPYLFHADTCNDDYACP